ncbi:MAG: type II toxin-antitoxin system VapC family toxin [Oscillospiraceae bacterium]|nr:type II toxin-antitoxin system VapC family toxin [Oscillospiraceae bacterium]
MKILLDTHILLWALTDDPHLPSKARRLIENPDNTVFYSIVSPWEVEIKRLAHPKEMALGAEELVGYCAESGFHCLPVREEHIFLLGSLQREPLSPPHRDPFDRIMVCQCASDNLLFVTHDALIAGYTDPCIFFV